MLIKFTSEEIKLYNNIVSSFTSIYFMILENGYVLNHKEISLENVQKVLYDYYSKIGYDNAKTLIYHVQSYNPTYLDDFMKELTKIKSIYHDLEKTPTIGALIKKDIHSDFYLKLFHDIKNNLRLLAENTGLVNNKYYNNLNNALVCDINHLYTWFKYDLYVKASNMKYYRDVDLIFVRSLCDIIEKDFQLFQSEVKTNEFLPPIL